MMKRIRIHTIVLIAVYALLPIIVVLMLHNISVSNVLIRMGSDGFGEEQRNIYLDDKNAKGEFVEEIKKINNPFALYMDEKKDSGVTIRQIYFNKEYEKLPMESGRFLNAGDLFENNNAVVVGKNLKDKIYREDSVDYIDINGTKCNVVGIYGYEETTFYDSYVFINMLSDVDIESKMMTIDFLSYTDDADTITETCINNLAEKKIKVHLLSISEVSYMSSLVPTVNAGAWFAVLVVSCFLSVMAASIQWFSAKRKEISVKRLLGASASKVSREISIKYICMMSVSVAVGIIYCKIVYFGYINFLLGGYGLLVCFGLIFLILIYIKIRKIKLYAEVTV